jgi:hypothetical protein
MVRSNISTQQLSSQRKETTATHIRAENYANLDGMNVASCTLSNEYIVQFWVGLLDGDGSIQVNHWRKRSLLYRIVIKLPNNVENVNMFCQIQQNLGGRVKFDKEFVFWVENYKKNICKLFDILIRMPPQTTRRLRQLQFALLCMVRGDDVIWYLDNRNLKYSDCLYSKQSILSLENLTSRFAAQLLLQTSPITSAKSFLIERVCNSKLQHKERGSFWASHVRKLCFGAKQTWARSAPSLPVYFPAWLSGFIEAEGYFFVPKNVKQSSAFTIGQKNERHLLENILYYLGATNQSILCKEKDFYVVHISRKDFIMRLKAHLSAFPLLGYKHVQYQKFLTKLSHRCTEVK